MKIYHKSTIAVNLVESLTFLYMNYKRHVAIRASFVVNGDTIGHMLSWWFFIQKRRIFFTENSSRFLGNSRVTYGFAYVPMNRELLSYRKKGPKVSSVI